MFSFLSGKLSRLGGGLGQQAGGGFMDRMRQNLQRPQFRQGMAGMGAQMMGLDPALGQMAAQGIQQRRFGQALAQGIPPIDRQRFDPRQFMPQQRQRFDLSQLHRLPMQQQMQRQQIDPRQFMPQQRPRFDLTQLQRLPMQQQMTGVIRNPTY